MPSGQAVSPPGTRVEDKWYVDGKAVCPRPAMLGAMYAIQPWEVEMGDGCTIPSQGALLPPILGSIQPVHTSCKGMLTLVVLWTAGGCPPRGVSNPR